MSASPIAIPTSHWPHRLPGLALAAAIGLIALLLGRLAPLIGGPVIAIVLGMILSTRGITRPMHRPGLAFASRQVLQASIIALGFGLSLGQLAKVGSESLPIMLATLGVAFATAWLLGRWLGVPDKLKVLVGVGTAICGGSAIAAVTPIIQPEDHDVALAMSTIFLFNIVAVLAFPVLGHWMQLSDPDFGLWAGTAINDTAAVVAASYSYSDAAGEYATVVKLTRATMIIPICLILAIIVAAKARRSTGQTNANATNLAATFPWFILWFVVAAGLRSAGLVPDVLLPIIKVAAEFFILIALSAIGLSANLRRIVKTGAKPVLLGLGVWFSVAASSLLMQWCMKHS